MSLRDGREGKIEGGEEKENKLKRKKDDRRDE